MSEPRTFRFARIVGGLYAFFCCWLPMLWLIHDQMARYEFHQHEFLLMHWRDQVALILLGALGLWGSLVIVLGDRR